MTPPHTTNYPKSAQVNEGTRTARASAGALAAGLGGVLGPEVAAATAAKAATVTSAEAATTAPAIARASLAA